METKVSWVVELGCGEAEAMSLNYEAIRKSESKKWTDKCRLEANEKMASIKFESPWLDVSIENGPNYRIEGEAGQWEFETFKVVGINGTQRTVLHDTRSNFPIQRGLARLRSSGAQDLLLFFGMGRQTTRETAELFNRVRHQPEAIASSTLRDYEEREGHSISAELNATTEAVLKTFKQPAMPIMPQTPVLSADESILTDAFLLAKIPTELEKEVKSNPVPYSMPKETVYVIPDAVSCKKQKEHRKASSTLTNEKDNSRKTVSSCVATVMYQGQKMSVLAPQYLPLARQVIAVMITNKLLNQHCCLISDGERKIREVFIEILAPIFGSLHHVLDWHHLERRVAQMLSLSIKGTDIRNAHLKKLKHLLWFGCTSSAIEYLKAISPDEIKSKKHLIELEEYFLRRRSQIPVYAVRKELGLANSSNPVEKANDRIVSCRQKHKGMSWSQEGSSALASIRMVAYNGQQALWVQQRRISLKFRNIAS